MSQCRLCRADGRPPAPVRIVHLGVGSFFRAHRAWHTDRAPDAHQWGIAAFTGHSRATADVLRQQDCLYTLLARNGEQTTTEVVSAISAISEVHAGDDAVRRWRKIHTVDFPGARDQVGSDHHPQTVARWTGVSRRDDGRARGPGGGASRAEGAWIANRGEALVGRLRGRGDVRLTTDEIMAMRRTD